MWMKVLENNKKKKGVMWVEMGWKWVEKGWMKGIKVEKMWRDELKEPKLKNAKQLK